MGVGVEKEGKHWIMIEEVLQGVQKKFGGTYRKGSVSKVAQVDFDIAGRKFLVTPDITEGTAYSSSSSSITGICISCQCSKPHEFYITKESALNRWGWSKKHPILDTKTKQHYVLKCSEGTYQRKCVE